MAYTTQQELPAVAFVGYMLVAEIEGIERVSSCESTDHWTACLAQSLYRRCHGVAS